MLKTTDKNEQSTHFSYNEYKKKVHKAPNKDLTIFVAVFLVGVIMLLGFAKLLSPNVDVAISVDDGSSVQELEKSSIDERLRAIKMEDEGKLIDDTGMFSPELDERVILPQQNKKTVGQVEAEKVDKELSKDYFKPAESSAKKVESAATENVQKAPQPTASFQSVPVAETVNAKVVVGYYATEKQAEVAKSILQDAGLGINALVKNMGGYYTLQVGSYSSRENAQRAANDLLKSNFPARVIVE